MLGCSTATFSDGQLPQKQRPSRHQHCRMGVCGASRPAAQNFLRLRQLWASRFVVHRPAGLRILDSCILPHAGDNSKTLQHQSRHQSRSVSSQEELIKHNDFPNGTELHAGSRFLTGSQAPNCGAPARERPATQRQVGLPHQLPQQPESILQVDSKRCAQVQSS